MSRALLAAIYGHLGRPDEARAQWQELLQINPNYSIEHRRKVLPYKNPADFDPFVDGLQKGWLDGLVAKGPPPSVARPNRSSVSKSTMLEQQKGCLVFRGAK